MAELPEPLEPPEAPERPDAYWLKYHWIGINALEVGELELLAEQDDVPRPFGWAIDGSRLTTNMRHRLLSYFFDGVPDVDKLPMVKKFCLACVAQRLELEMAPEMNLQRFNWDADSLAELCAWFNRVFPLFEHIVCVR